MIDYNKVTYTGYFEAPTMENGALPGTVASSGKTGYLSTPYTENKETPEEASKAAEKFAHGKPVKVARCTWKSARLMGNIRAISKKKPGYNQRDGKDQSLFFCVFVVLCHWNNCTLSHIRKFQLENLSTLACAQTRALLRLV